MVAPSDDVPCLLKARRSIFYETPIEYLLNQSDTRRIVLTGQVTEQCILYSALDGYIRHFDVVVVRGPVAPTRPSRRRRRDDDGAQHAGR